MKFMLCRKYLQTSQFNLTSSININVIYVPIKGFKNNFSIYNYTQK